VTGPTVDVVVPSYRRPASLARCLRALRAQTVEPERVLVVLRRGDETSWLVARDEAWERVRLIEVEEPGMVAALTAGVAASGAEAVAFTDDDAAPRPDWLGRLTALLALPDVGAAGGRDLLPGRPAATADVGRRTRFGKLVGNHHVGTGPARDVDVLKGVNMAVRAECLALPRAGVLRGDGAPGSGEILVCAHVSRLGRRIVYDPSIEVEHEPAERPDGGSRVRPSRERVRESAHNFVVATAALDRKLLPRQALYGLLLGDRGAPGIGRGLAALARGEREVLNRVGPALAGSLLGAVRTASGELRSPVVTCAELRLRPSAVRTAGVREAVR